MTVRTRARSGRGREGRLRLRSRAPTAKSCMTKRKEMVYTPESVSTLAPRARERDPVTRKNVMGMRWRVPRKALRASMNWGRHSSSAIRSMRPPTPTKAVSTAPERTMKASMPSTRAKAWPPERFATAARRESPPSAISAGERTDMVARARSGLRTETMTCMLRSTAGYWPGTMASIMLALDSKPETPRRAAPNPKKMAPTTPEEEGSGAEKAAAKTSKPSSAAQTTAKPRRVMRVPICRTNMATATTADSPMPQAVRRQKTPRRQRTIQDSTGVSMRTQR
mmetsp:Transcript_10719/g.41626  ORF Transcript_10719/g.41626 Transcript_10719/m.41626 type:complete len:281 (+) Transcript_10719:503-1345(+)